MVHASFLSPEFTCLLCLGMIIRHSGFVQKVQTHTVLLSVNLMVMLVVQRKIIIGCEVLTVYRRLDTSLTHLKLFYLLQCPQYLEIWYRSFLFVSFFYSLLIKNAIR